MTVGTIKKLVEDKGFGFIETGSDKDMFFHCSAVTNAEFSALTEGDEVEFETGEGPKGPRAENVRLR